MLQNAGSPFSLPDFLVNRIRKGRVMLFLGAGASIDSMNIENTSPPLGTALARILSEATGIAYENEPLSIVAASAKEQLGDREYWTILKRNYQHCRPSNAYLTITRYYWPRIYTVNIDDALEAAFAANGVRWEPLVHISPVGLPRMGDDIVQYIKLNGSIDRLESGLIFTPEEYKAMQPRQDTWYEEVARDFLENTFIFIGTQLQEPAFEWQVNRLKKNSGQSNGRSYIICPRFTEHVRRDLRLHNIEAIEGTIDDFARALSIALGSKLSAAKVAEHRNPALYELLSPEVRSRLGEFKSEFDSVELLNKQYMDREKPKEKSSIRPFYYGFEPSWRDVLDGVPARLSAQDAVLDALQKDNRTILIHGPAGCGKTTLLMMSALEYSLGHPEELVLWINKNGPFPINLIRELCMVFDNRALFFVDDIGNYLEYMEDLVGPHSRYSGRIIACERTNVLRRKEQGLDFDEIVKIVRINDDDVDPILNKIEEFGPWGRLSKMEPEERKQTLIKVADKQLLVGLREATMGYGFDRILQDEYKTIPEGRSRDIALLVALASMHRQPLSKKTLLDALGHLGYVPPLNNIEQGLEEIVHFSERYVQFRHPIIAEYLVSRVIDKELVVGGIRSLLLSLSRFAFPIRVSAKGPDARLFIALTNHEFLWLLFRSKKEHGLSLFKDVEMYFRGDALFWLQYALFEQKCGVTYLENAINHVRMALNMYPDSMQISNAFANIHFDAALEAGNAESALLIMEEATSRLEMQCGSPVTEAYALVGLAHGRLRVLKRWFPERVPEEWKHLRNRLKEAHWKYPDNVEISRALRQIPLQTVKVAKRSKSRRGRKRTKGN